MKNETGAKARVRLDRVVAHIGARGEVSVHALADHFKLSLMTVRRDLMQLEKAGRVTRTHGGAILSRPGVAEFTFVERGEQGLSEKQAIAAAVAALIPAGSTVALDNGTTTLAVAKAIAGIERLTVLTCSLAIASVLYSHDTITLVLLGGSARKGSPDLVGWLTEENLKSFHVDYAIVGADGITSEGAYTTAVDLARICQAILHAGAQSVLVADSSKVGRASFCRYAGLNEFDHVITDSGIPAAARKWLGRDTTRLTVVGKRSTSRR
jgi:DeoR/GlpR family transcriptional regulator of sugar metabolism